MNDTQYILLMAFLILMSAYFSATETAFSSMNKTRLKNLAEKGNKKAELACRLSDKYDKLISTILVGNNIVNIAVSSIATVFFIAKSPTHGATIATAVITILVLIFGEITPKSIAKDAAEKFAMFSAPLINILIFVLTPVNFIFSMWKKFVAKVFKIEESAKMSPEELIMLVEEVQQEGTIDDDDSELIRNAIEFADLAAEDILTHRVDLEAVSLEEDKVDIARKFKETQFSRLLVYNESIDDIVGIIHLKDFYSENGITKKTVRELMTKPLFIQKGEKINDLLKILQTNKSHIAVVIDEYGGTLGIVTMEDILEELVGEIWDEHDEVVENFKEVDTDIYRVEGSVNFDDFCDFFDIEAESESISVGGWAMECLGKIPETGDNFEFDNLKISILETDSHRVTLIQVIRCEKSNNEDEFDSSKE